MLLTMKHLLVVVTLFFQALNVVSGEQEPVDVVMGCWPSNINKDKVLGKINQKIIRESYLNVYFFR